MGGKGTWDEVERSSANDAATNQKACTEGLTGDRDLPVREESNKETQMFGGSARLQGIFVKSGDGSLASTSGSEEATGHFDALFETKKCQVLAALVPPPTAPPQGLLEIIKNPWSSKPKDKFLDTSAHPSNTVYLNVYDLGLDERVSVLNALGNNNAFFYWWYISRRDRDLRFRVDLRRVFC